MSSPPITFGSLEFNSAAEDPQGLLWVCENLEGWADPPGTTQELTQRVYDHGGWYGDGWYIPRVLTLDGAIVAPDQATLQQALHAFRAQHAAATRADATLLVEEVDGPRTLTVRTSQTVPQVSYLGPLAVRLVAEIVAAWPIKAGTARSFSAGNTTPGTGRTYPRGGAYPWWTYGPSGSSGDMQANNQGNAPVHPIWLIHGPVTNPRIIAPDRSRTLAFTITLAAGDTLAIDVATHTVLLNQLGNRRYVLTPASAWFDLLPGPNLIQYRSDSNTGSLTVYFSDGWW